MGKINQGLGAQEMAQRKEEECLWCSTPSCHTPPALVVGTKTHTEDVGGGGQRELHAVDNEGQGGQAVDTVTVHKILQKEQGQQGLSPTSKCHSASSHQTSAASLLLD